MNANWKRVFELTVSKALRLGNQSALTQDAGGTTTLAGTNTLSGATTVSGALTASGTNTLSGPTNVTNRLTTTDGVTAGTARVVGGLQFSMTAASAALTGSVTETVLGSASIPANTLKLGSVMRIRYQGIVTADAGATTLTVRVRIGPTTLIGTAILATAAVDTSANFIFVGDIDFTARAAPGATAACVTNAIYTDPVAAAGAVKVNFLGTTNFATNGALLVEVTGQWSASDANSCRLDMLDISIF